MAPLFKTCFLAAALAGLCSTAPVENRDMVYEYTTDIRWVVLTSTITVIPTEASSVANPDPQHPTYVQPPPVTTTTTTTTTSPPPPQPKTTTTTTTTTVATTTTTSAQPTTTSTSSGSSGSGSSGGSSPIGICTSDAPCSGEGTYYDTATSMSSPSFCDTANDGTSENVLALSVDIMTEALCGKTITASYGGNTVTGTVVEKCMGCGSGSIDMSRHMFGELAGLGAGRIPLDWWFS